MSEHEPTDPRKGLNDPRRRKLLAALGLGGVAAYVAPTLFSLGQAQAQAWHDAGIVVEIGGRRHRRQRRGSYSRPSYSRPSYSRPSYSRPSYSRPSYSRPSRW
nr:hypothetical protein [Halomonas socia]